MVGRGIEVDNKKCVHGLAGDLEVKNSRGHTPRQLAKWPEPGPHMEGPGSNPHGAVATGASRRVYGLTEIIDQPISAEIAFHCALLILSISLSVCQHFECAIPMSLMFLMMSRVSWIYLRSCLFFFPCAVLGAWVRQAITFAVSVHGLYTICVQ